MPARLAVATAALVLVSVVGSACVFGPTVTCGDVAQDDCDRAVEMAKPLLDAYWDQATEVLVHPGVCSLAMAGCSHRQATFPGFLTVELVPHHPSAASVVIDQHDPGWTASCRLIVADSNGAHGEPCAED
ncbi:MAG TPA: hypothetical protein VF114_07995 [Candidatus Limnocylindria bacterium]